LKRVWFININVMTNFDINKFKNLNTESQRYTRRISFLNSIGIDTQHIEKTVEQAAQNFTGHFKSFVIYGEPQSGKTEMMIALTAKLLDFGYKIVIILLNDNLQLLNQNLDRFRKSGIDPTPVNVCGDIGDGPRKYCYSRPNKT